MKIYIIKKIRESSQEIPAGEIVKDGNTIKLNFNDYILFRILKALFSRSLCDKIVNGGTVIKNISNNKLLTVLSKLRRPYFIGSEIDIPWKYTEVLC